MILIWVAVLVFRFTTDPVWRRVAFQAPLAALSQLIL